MEIAALITLSRRDGKTLDHQNDKANYIGYSIKCENGTPY